MSENSGDDDLEQLREERLEELQEQAGGEGGEEAAAQREAAQQQADAKKKALLRQYLSDDARKRLNTVKMSKPDFGEKVEQQVVALAQSGRIQGKIDDEKMRQLLNELKPEEKSFDIRRR